MCTAEAPATTTLRVCAACGLNDRYHDLRDRHRPANDYDGPREKGGICPGPVQTITYRRPDTFGKPVDHEARMEAARARAEWELGDPSWAGHIVGAYLYPADDREALLREQGVEEPRR